MYSYMYIKAKNIYSAKIIFVCLFLHFSHLYIFMSSFNLVFVVSIYILFLVSTYIIYGICNKDFHIIILNYITVIKRRIFILMGKNFDEFFFSTSPSEIRNTNKSLSLNIFTLNISLHCLQSHEYFNYFVVQLTR